MYNIKILINKMKDSANIKTNTDLSEHLNVSYNTLNTWIKRNKLPQEIIINFATKYNISLDYLLNDNIEHNNLFSSSTNKHSTHSNSTIKIDTNNDLKRFTYYGEYKPLSIVHGSILELNSALLHSNGYYLLKYNDIYFISLVKIDAFSNTVELNTLNDNKTMELTKFNSINMGLIVKITD